MKELCVNEILNVSGGAPFDVFKNGQISTSDILYSCSLAAFAVSLFPLVLPVMVVYKAMVG